MLEFCTLGTGGTLPVPERALSSLYVRSSGRALLIDCGEGTQVGIRRLGWGFRCLDGLLLTHFSTSIEDPEEYIPETRTIFERTWAAKDGETVTLRYPEGSEKAWTSLS